MTRLAQHVSLFVPRLIHVSHIVTQAVKAKGIPLNEVKAQGNNIIEYQFAQSSILKHAKAIDELCTLLATTYKLPIASYMCFPQGGARNPLYRPHRVYYALPAGDKEFLEWFTILDTMRWTLLGLNQSDVPTRKESLEVLKRDYTVMYCLNHTDSVRHIVSDNYLLTPQNQESSYLQLILPTVEMAHTVMNKMNAVVKDSAFVFAYRTTDSSANIPDAMNTHEQRLIYFERKAKEYKAAKLRQLLDQ